MHTLHVVIHKILQFLKIFLFFKFKNVYVVYYDLSMHTL